jgi:hypothetical protein
MRRLQWLTMLVLSLGPLCLAAEEQVVPDPEWQVARAQFTSGIRNREPIDRLVVASPLIREVYFFTDLRHLQGRTVMHRWMYNGQVVSQVPFEVGGPRWRVNSKKEIDPDQVGEWSVTVVDQSGWPLYTELFRYENGAPLVQPSVAPEDAGEDDAADPAAQSGSSGQSAGPGASAPAEPDHSVAPPGGAPAASDSPD